MLLALWPAFVVPRLTLPSGRRVSSDAAQRAENRTPAIIAAEEHLRRLENSDVSTSNNRTPDGVVDLPSVSDSDNRIGGVAVRVLGHERQGAGSVPAAFGTSFAESDALPSNLNAAMKAYAARQAADEDDEAAIIAVLLGRLI